MHSVSQGNGKLDFTRRRKVLNAKSREKGRMRLLWFKECHDVAQRKMRLNAEEPRDALAIECSLHATDTWLITERHNQARHPKKDILLPIRFNNKEI
jgi:hypothetical protein